MSSISRLAFAVGGCVFIAGLLPLAGAQDSSAVPVDPRGPIAGWVGKTLVNDQGVQAVDFKFTPPIEAAWDPQWIWVATAEPGGKVPTAAHFRKELTLPAGALITSAYAKVSADRVYRLWVNGRLVSRGPADPGNDIILWTHWSHRWLYNQVDLAPYLHAGLNVIAAEVFTANMIPSYSLGHPGFAMEAEVQLSNGPGLTFSTGSGWKAKALDAYSEGPLNALAPRPPAKSSPAGLLYDARLDDPAWRNAAFSQSDWPDAAKIDSTWGTLSVSQIPEAMEAVWPVESIGSAMPNVTTSAPLSEIGHSIGVSGDGAFNVNFGRVISAYLSMKVNGAAGTVITLEPSETHADPSHRPVQVTRDLPNFWRGSYAAVRADLRGRYPRHPWPEDPLSAPATRRAKPRGQ